jgi:hypothetical protein
MAGKTYDYKILCFYKSEILFSLKLIHNFHYQNRVIYVIIQYYNEESSVIVK